MKESYEDLYNGPDYLKEYFQSLVNIVENPIGVYNRHCVLNRLKAAVPGEAVMTAWCDYGSYHDLFYENSKPMPNQNKLDELTQVTSDTWSNNSVPFVCDTIYNVTRETREYVDIDKVRQAEKTITQLMGNRHTEFYRHLLETHSNPTANAYAKLTDSQKESAKVDYIGVITNYAWINNKIIARDQGNWPDPDWELYHHWNKIRILGAAAEEIENVITAIESKGLSVPESVNVQNWQKYDRWVTEGRASGNVKWEDFREAADAMNYSRNVGEIYCTEIYSFLFMGGGNPGGSYWKKPPDPSCFSSDTMVLMYDGSLKKISRIVSGDKITTPQGQKKVMLVSVPLRGKRDLYSLEGHTFCFSATHPFLSKNGYACVDPYELCAAIPTFCKEKVEQLGENSCLITPSGEEHLAGKIKTHPFVEGCENEFLYDLIPEIESSGCFQYYVGDENMQYLISSEVPNIKGREDMAQAFMEIFEKIAAPILEQANHIEDCKFWECVQPKLLQYTKTILPVRLARRNVTNNSKKTAVAVGTHSFFAYAETFDNTSLNIRVGLLFSAAFSVFLSLLMQKKFSIEEAEQIGRIIAEAIEAKELVF